MPTPDFSKVWASNSPLPAYTFSDSDYLTGWDFVGSAPPTKNEFDAFFKLVDEKLNYLYSQLQDTASKLYPIGSVYISFNSANPSTLFGGTWTRLKDTFLLANGDSYAPNTTGGSATKTIGVTNMPPHNHPVNASTHSHSVTTAGAGSHTHTASSNTTGSHTHKRGTMNITGTFSGVGNVGGGSATLTGAFYRVNSTAHPSQGVVLANEGEKDDYFGFDASRTGAWTGETESKGSHSHTITVNSVGNHTHTVTISNGGSHTHTTNNTGGGTPLNIMPPYQTVYMWRRTA